MDTLKNSPGDFSSPKYCPDGEGQKRVMERAWGAVIRGFVVSLLMPIDALQRLRRGHSVGWRTMVFWILSVVFYICGAGFWRVSRGWTLAGYSQASTTVFCLAGMLLAAVVNDGLLSGEGASAQAPGNFRTRHHRHGHWHRHHGVHLRTAVSAHGESQPSLHQKGAVNQGICCGDCRQCLEDICLAL